MHVGDKLPRLLARTVLASGTDVDRPFDLCVRGGDTGDVVGQCSVAPLHSGSTGTGRRCDSAVRRLDCGNGIRATVVIASLWIPSISVAVQGEPECTAMGVDTMRRRFSLCVDIKTLRMLKPSALYLRFCPSWPAAASSTTESTK